MKKHVYHLAWMGFALLAIQCTKETTVIDLVSQDTTPYIIDTKGAPPPVIAPDNPLTVQGVKLGKMLFYETRLSKDNTQSCASCHMQEFAFSDTARLSTGVSGFHGKRQAMAVVNMAYNTNEFFWDGRAHLLRDQSLMPIQDSLEMAETLENVVAKLSADASYKDQFTRAFGSETINPLRISLALEQFMNSMVSFNSKFDKFQRGEVALTPAEMRGRRLFFTEFNPAFPDSSGGDCAHCHGGLNFANNRYSNNGLDADGDFQDYGREGVTNHAQDRGRFKIPTLRNIALTPPYMHDGRFNTLAEVVQHYNTGMKASSTLDPILVFPQDEGGLQLSQQDVSDLVAFLHTLTDAEFTTNEEYSSPF